MAKKVILGCLGVGILATIAGGFLIWSLFVSPLMSGMAVLEDIHEANERIFDRSSYTPPADGELTAGQVDRFVAVQTEIQSRLEDQLAEYQDKYEELGRQWEDQDRDPSIREMMNVWEDVVQFFAEAKQIQVDALNEQNFSLEEYRWVQQSFYQALGVELFPYNLDEMARAAQDGDFDFDLDEFESMQQDLEDIPEQNRQLVQQYMENADAWITFAWFGL